MAEANSTTGSNTIVLIKAVVDDARIRSIAFVPLWKLDGLYLRHGGVTLATPGEDMALSIITTTVIDMLQDTEQVDSVTVSLRPYSVCCAANGSDSDDEDDDTSLAGEADRLAWYGQQAARRPFCEATFVGKSLSRANLPSAIAEKALTYMKWARGSTSDAPP
jgi:hypothetical protein